MSRDWLMPDRERSNVVGTSDTSACARAEVPRAALVDRVQPSGALLAALHPPYHSNARLGEPRRNRVGLPYPCSST